MFKSTQPSDSEGAEAPLHESGSTPGLQMCLPVCKGCWQRAWLKVFQPLAGRQHALCTSVGSLSHVAVRTRLPPPTKSNRQHVKGPCLQCKEVHSAPACRSCGGPGCPRSARCSRALQGGRSRMKSRRSGKGAGGPAGLHIRMQVCAATRQVKQAASSGARHSGRPAAAVTRGKNSTQACSAKPNLPATPQAHSRQQRPAGAAHLLRHCRAPGCPEHCSPS